MCDRNSLKEESVSGGKRERDGHGSLKRDANKRRGLKGFAIETKARDPPFRVNGDGTMEQGRKRTKEKEGKEEKRQRENGDSQKRIRRGGVRRSGLSLLEGNKIGEPERQRRRKSERI